MPFPLRFFRCHPFAALFTALLLLVVTTRLLWGLYFSYRLARQIESNTKLGGITSLAELDQPKLPDEENAYAFQARAYEAIAVDSPSEANEDHGTDPEVPAKWMQLAEKSEGANGRVFELVREARSRTTSQIRATNRIDPIGANFSLLMILGRTLRDGALYAHAKGNDAEAIERLLDSLHVARTARQDALLVSQLVGMTIENATFQEIYLIGAGLRVAPDGGPRAARPAQVRRLIHALLDESPCVAMLPRAIAAEPWTYHQALLRQRARGSWLLRPLTDMEMLHIHRATADAMKASAMPDHVSAKAALPPEPRVTVPAYMAPVRTKSDNFIRIPGDDVARPYSRWFYFGPPSSGVVMERHFRTLAERRTAATALAIHLFRAEHGRWPTGLEEIIPDYLPAAPADPFTPGKPIRYVPDGLPGPERRPLLVWNIDGDEGAVPPTPKYWFYDEGYRSPRRLRQYRDLTRFKPPLLH